MSEKVNFGCGVNYLQGWHNHDIEVDIRNRLPYADDSVDYILAEHVVEHVNPREAYKFFEECLRILKSGGVVRIAVPSVTRIFKYSSPEYLQFLKNHGYGDGSKKSAVYNIIFNHGHECIWNVEALLAVMGSIGFDCIEKPVSVSSHLDLVNVEGHTKVLGQTFNEIETCVVEGTKL